MELRHTRVRWSDPSHGALLFPGPDATMRHLRPPPTGSRRQSWPPTRPFGTRPSAVPPTADTRGWSLDLRPVLLVVAATASVHLVAAGSMPWQLLRESVVVLAAVTSVLLARRGSDRVRVAIDLLVAVALLATLVAPS